MARTTENQERAGGGRRIETTRKSTSLDWPSAMRVPLDGQCKRRSSGSIYTSTQARGKGTQVVKFDRVPMMVPCSPSPHPFAFPSRDIHDYTLMTTAPRPLEQRGNNPTSQIRSRTRRSRLFISPPLSPLLSLLSNMNLRSTKIPITPPLLILPQSFKPTSFPLLPRLPRPLTRDPCYDSPHCPTHFLPPVSPYCTSQETCPSVPEISLPPFLPGTPRPNPSRKARAERADVCVTPAEPHARPTIPSSPSLLPSSFSPPQLLLPPPFHPPPPSNQQKHQQTPLAGVQIQPSSL